MKKLSREKIALVIFLCLVVFGLGVVAFYIGGVGHSWNVAASTIDEATGNLEDYTVVLYDGTAVEKKQTQDQDFEKTPTASLNSRSSDESQKAAESELTASEVMGDSDAATRRVTLEEVRDSYIEKNASVLILDVIDPQVYEKQTIVRAGKYRFGILGVTAQDDLASIQKRIDDYKALKVDFVVAVVDKLDSIESLDQIKYNGLDLVISAQEEGLLDEGVNVDHVFYNDAALIGEVGSVLISPSKVLSAKDVSSL